MNPRLTESERAQAWRLRRNLTQQQLADLTGWTKLSIYILERGINTDGKPTTPWVWQRYKMACAGVEAKLRGQEFDW